MKDKEIEVKFMINEKIRANIEEDLKKVAEKLGESRLVDVYFESPYLNFEINGETVEALRIRENDKGCVMTYKKIHLECNPVYCDEFETKIDSREQMEKILFALGFKVQMMIDKTRTSYKLDNFEFDFDSVKDLGELLEVELKNENGRVEDIYNFVAKYGLSEKDVTYKGIQKLLEEAKGKR